MFKGKKILPLILSLAVFAVFSGCQSEEEPFTGVKLSLSSSIARAGSQISLTGTYYNEDVADSSREITYSLSDDNTGGAYFGSEGQLSITGKSGCGVNLTLGSKDNSSVKITAQCEGASASISAKTFTVFALDESPSGYAGVNFSSFYDSNKIATVTTKADLVTYAKKGGYTIIIDGMIDMSEGMLPSSGGASTPALDSFVAATSSYSTYADYNTQFSSVSASDDKSNDLNSKYGSIVRLSVESNTAIFGKSSNCGIKGGSIYISGKSNVILRNLLIQDAYDPFPKHKKNDGWNAEQDNVHIEKSTNVWVDHCTIEDTLTLSKAANGEKWQTYDGLCDITNIGSFDTYVTVSNCIFRNHDKTMLIGSSDSDGSYSSASADESKVRRFVTLSGNSFKNCGQRLPMVRNSLIHIYNNYYAVSASPYTSQSAVNARNGSIIYSENNYFDSGLKYSFNASKTNATAPVLHSRGDGGPTSGNKSNISARDDEVFSSAVNKYTYSALSASYSASSAGAGQVVPKI